MSVPQIPHAATRNRTSPSRISGIGTDSTTTRPLPRYTPARMCSDSFRPVSCTPIFATVWLIALLHQPSRTRQRDSRGFAERTYRETLRARSLPVDFDEPSAKARATVVGAAQLGRRLS